MVEARGTYEGDSDIYQVKSAHPASGVGRGGGESFNQSKHIR